MKNEPITTYMGSRGRLENSPKSKHPAISEKSSKITPLGLAQPAKTKAITRICSKAVSPAVSLVSELDEKAIELLKVWQSLDQTQRDELLAFAIQLASCHKP